MEKMPKIVLPISLQFDISIDWNLWQNKHCWYVFLSYQCQPIAMSNKKWADMGTFNKECYVLGPKISHSFLMFFFQTPCKVAAFISQFPSSIVDTKKKWWKNAREKLIESQSAYERLLPDVSRGIVFCIRTNFIFFSFLLVLFSIRCSTSFEKMVWPSLLIWGTEFLFEVPNFYLRYWILMTTFRKSFFLYK